MASATVILKEGKSYTYVDGQRVFRFTQSPTTVVGQELIDKLKGITQLAVEVNEDRPLPKATVVSKQPIKRVAPRQPEPAPAPEPEPEVEVDLEAIAEEVDSEAEAEAEVELEAEVEPAVVAPPKAKPILPKKKA